MPTLPGGQHSGRRRQRGGVGCQEGGPGGLHGCLPDVVPQLDVQGRRALAAWLGRWEGALGQPCIKTTPFTLFYITASKSFCLEKRKKITVVFRLVDQTALRAIAVLLRFNFSLSFSVPLHRQRLGSVVWVDS